VKAANYRFSPLLQIGNIVTKNKHIGVLPVTYSRKTPK
jgi:hypothetical protein